MKQFLIKSILVASALSGVTALANAAVVDIQIDSSLLFEYTETTFNLFDDFGYIDPNVFESDYPVFSFTDDYDVNGYGEFGYEFLKYDVDSSFDLTEVYDWNIEVDFDYEYEYDLNGEPLRGDDDIGFFSVKETFSVTELTDILFGITPEAVAAIVTGLPGTGSVTDLIMAFNSLANTSIAWPYASSIDSSKILYHSEFGMPYGDLQFAIDAPIDNVESAYFDGVSTISITAERRVSVPDSGNSSMLAFIGFGVLGIARLRYRKIRTA